MAKPDLQKRVAALEKQIAEIKAEHIADKPWLRTLGMFAGDQSMKEVFKEALRLREQDRRRSRRTKVAKSNKRRASK